MVWNGSGVTRTISRSSSGMANSSRARAALAALQSPANPPPTTTILLDMYFSLARRILLCVPVGGIIGEVTFARPYVTVLSRERKTAGECCG